ncbi:holin [Mycobacterium phage VC3]|nr:holin [Mycobacterium phage VC3]QJD52478.1 holin [Mycobacterium phage ANI8]BBC43569.1 putative holin [Mycobacterium phage C3]
MSPKIRETLYYVGTLVPGILGIALIWGGIDAGAAANVGDIVAGALNLIGATAPATAAVKVNRQRKDGTLTASPVEQVTKGVEQVLAAKQTAEAEVERVKQALETAVNGAVPQLGPLASQILNGVLPAYSQPFDPRTEPWNR